MTYRKHVAKLLGFSSVAALGLVAFAASAQAVAPGFLINKSPVGTLLATAGAGEDGVNTMLVPGLGFELTCKAFAIDEGLIESNTDAKLKLLYTECTTLSIVKLPEEIHCHVSEPLVVEGLVLPAELTNGEPAMLLEKTKALIRLHLPGATLGLTPCVLPLDSVLTGEACIAIKNNDTIEPLIFANASVQCKERPALESLSEGAGVKDVLKYGAQTVTLDGTSMLFLTGAHSGLPLGVSLY